MTTPTYVHGAGEDPVQRPHLTWSYTLKESARAVVAGAVASPA